MVGIVLKSWKLKALALGLCPFFRPGSGFNKESVLKRHPRGCLLGGGGTYQDSGLENGVFNIVSKNQLRYHVFNTDFYTILWTIQSRPKWLPYS